MIREKGERVRVLGEGRKVGERILIQTESFNTGREKCVSISKLDNFCQSSPSYIVLIGKPHVEKICFESRSV